MGYPTFTFETDDEQFLLGTVEPLSDRLEEELDVMRYLIDNIWFTGVLAWLWKRIEINGGSEGSYCQPWACSLLLMPHFSTSAPMGICCGTRRPSVSTQLTRRMWSSMQKVLLW